MYSNCQVSIFEPYLGHIVSLCDYVSHTLNAFNLEVCRGNLIVEEFEV